jgi:quinol monooxygenase YgiN/mannose-6-phosphate isomerase-like protein (cupin superfamily)
MSKIGRYAKATAKPGQADALAERLLQVAEGLRDVPGCELYVVNRAVDDPDAVWVTEIWSSQEAVDASLAAADKDQIQEVLAMTESFERIDLVPLGGAGLRDAPRPGHTVLNLAEAEDLAAKFGYGETGQARFPSDDLDADDTGVSLQELRPGARQAFAHRHHRAEEVYLVLRGSGRMKIGDDVIDVAPMDAVRVGPEQTRAFEAGPDGLEFLAFGPRMRGDAELVRDWWTD